MNLIFAVYSLCLLSYYFSMASAVSIIFNLDTVLIWLIPALAVILFVSYLLRDRKFLKYLAPLIGYVFAFIFAKASFVYLLPPAFFMFLVLYSDRLDFMLERFSEHFMWMLRTLPFFIVFALLFDYQKSEKYLLPYVIICLGCGFLVLRMIRHEAKTIASLRFKLLNIASVCIFLFAGYLLSSDAYLKIAGEVLGFVYNYTLAPVLTALAYIIGLVGGWIIWLFSLLNTGINQEQQQQTPHAPPNFDFGERVEVDIRGIIISIAVIAAIIAIYFILKKLGKKRISRRSAEGVFELRERIEETDEKRKGFGFFAPTEPRKAIRYYYRKFLLLCLNKKLPIKNSQSSLEVQNVAAAEFDETNLSDIRQIYIPARYDDKADIGKSDVKKIKSIYKALKSTD